MLLVIILSQGQIPPKSCDLYFFFFSDCGIILVSFPGHTEIAQGLYGMSTICCSLN